MHSSSSPIQPDTTPPLQPTHTPLEGSRSTSRSGDLGQQLMAAALADVVECAAVVGAMMVAQEAKEEETIPRMVVVVASCLAEEVVA